VGLDTVGRRIVKEPPMFTYDIRQDFREVEMFFFGLVPVELAPPLRLAGVDEDDAEFFEESAIVRGID
jgi:hypothetical protein